MKRLSLVAVLMACIGFCGAVSAIPIYASAIVDSTNSNFGAVNVLGAPDGNVTNFFGENGRPGFVIVSFNGIIVDGPDDDVVVHLIDWLPAENEQFRVFASVDGISFSLLGDSGPPTGAIQPAASLVPFDLATAGLATAGFVLVENLSAAQDPSSIGPDIDAIEALHAVEITVPEPTTLALMSIALAGFGYARRRTA